MIDAYLQIITGNTTTEPTAEPLPASESKPPCSSSTAAEDYEPIVDATGRVVNVFVIVVAFVAVRPHYANHVAVPMHLHYTQMFTLHSTYERLVVL